MLDNATMITAGTDRAAAVVLHRTVALDAPRSQVTAARLRASAHGVYEARIDGRPVSGSVLDPGWTSYEWRLEVQTYDVTHLLDNDNNNGDDHDRHHTLGIHVLLGNGWWRGDLGFEGANANYGEEIGFIGELEITFADGHTQSVPTDTSWSGRTSEVLENSLYNGERIDARLRGTGVPLEVRETAFDRATLVARTGPQATRQEVLRPQRIWTSPQGRTLVDFGQNLVGWVRLRATGPAGTEIVVRHAEVLEDDELGTRPLRAAKATDTFVLSGGDDEFEPTLTFHGFRYAEVTGYPGRLTEDALEAVVVHSDMARIGTFTCSHDLVNRLVENSVWGQKGNFLHVPTDCPQRDERLGWTGDIAAYAATASFQYDTSGFLHRWLLDLAEETRHAGPDGVPHVVPDVLKHGNFSDPALFEKWNGPTAIWGDAAVWVPQALWEAYGDREQLAAHYPGMVLHLESVLPLLSENGLWDKGFQFGDWLDPDASPHEPWAAKADAGVVATACLYRSASFAAETARLIGEDADAARWEELADRTKEAFRQYYVEDGGRIRSDCATVYALAICFGLLDDATRAAAGRRLAEVVRDRDYRVTTGFAGTPFVTWALSETGHVDDAYRLLLETECPSWLYPVTKGATTIWERWDSMLPDGKINPGEMTSFNHYALGAVADWLYKVVAGIQPAAPGYARLRIAPTPGPGLDWAGATLRTPHGRVESHWRRTESGVEVRVVIPPGVEADVLLPDGSTTTVTGGEHVFR
ncbi:family 78 glycoside hydrolase catalytic domain [Streptomyces ochraceiscleroticus]|uniref:alpha-L-rhamnosidase n=1 Tax=Streptomyces ochraceiscleroticus TaxID=47761 RepID=A0ABW1MI62_9ACTN|nr:family 78 glycoside hydrolase catalytic domain [Streptomyces ochraceiscleroticus]